MSFGAFTFGSINTTGDASLNGRLFVGGDAELGGNIYVAGLSTFTGDVSMNNRLFIGNLIYNSANSLSVASDVSINGRLFLGGDASFAGNVNIAGNLKVLTTNLVNINNVTTTNYQLIIAEDLSLNGNLFIGSDVSMGGNVFTAGKTVLNGDVSMNNRLFTKTLVTRNDITVNGISVGTGSSAAGSIMIGKNNSNSATGSFVCIGSGAGNLLASATNITILGSNAANKIDYQHNSAYVGDNAGSNSIGSVLSNTVCGYNAMNNIRNGGNIIAVGANAMSASLGVNSHYNTAIGFNSFCSNGSATYTQVTCIGANSVPISGITSNAIFLGTSAETIYIQKKLINFNDISLNNRLFVGSDASFGGNFYISKKLGINNLTPQYNLDVSGTINSNNILYTNRLSNQIQASSSTTFDYNTGSVFYIDSPGSSNFTASFINVPTRLYQSYIIKLIINASTNKVYANAVNINGSAKTLYYNGGVSSVSVSSALMILQSIEIVNTSVSASSIITTVMSYQ
jgi:hypothetical protein